MISQLVEFIPAQSGKLAAVGLLVLLIGTAHAQVPAANAGGTAVVSEEQTWLIHAALNEEYRFRSSADPAESDHRLRVQLDGGVVHPSGHFLADVNMDLWYLLARQPSDPQGPFGLAAAHDYKDPWFAVYQLTGEYAGPGHLQVVRLGRQEAPHGRPGTFDGAYFLIAPKNRLSLFAFGGRSEHFFDVGGAFENWLGSAGGTIGVTPDLKLEADYRVLREVVEGDELQHTPLLGHSYGLAGWWRRAEWLRARFAVRGLNDRVSEASTAWQLLWPSIDLGLSASLYFQPTTLGEFNEADNPYFLTLGQSLSHLRWKLDIYKLSNLGRGSWEVHLGYAGRRLLADDETPFNRNLARLYALLGLKDLPLKGFTGSISVERVATAAFPLIDQGHLAVGGALGYERSWIQIEAGSQYHRYQYNYYVNVDEIADVRSVSADVRVKIARWLSARAIYRLEIFDRTLHTITVGLTQSYDREPGKQVPR